MLIARAAVAPRYALPPMLPFSPFSFDMQRFRHAIRRLSLLKICCHYCRHEDAAYVAVDAESAHDARRRCLSLIAAYYC